MILFRMMKTDCCMLLKIILQPKTPDVVILEDYNKGVLTENSD